ncbi:MAG: hypothetical protein ACFFEN_03220 [Candidatus Thorarchaeota archaeon]
MTMVNTSKTIGVIITLKLFEPTSNDSWISYILVLYCCSIWYPAFNIFVIS